MTLLPMDNRKVNFKKSEKQKVPVHFHFPLWTPWEQAWTSRLKDEPSGPSWVHPRTATPGNPSLTTQTPDSWLTADTSWEYSRPAQISRAIQLTHELVKIINNCCFETVCFTTLSWQWTTDINSLNFPLGKGIYNISWCQDLWNAMLFPNEFFFF